MAGTAKGVEKSMQTAWCRVSATQKLANLQDFGVFQWVSRAFKGIRPTGKGSGPLPVIDFKRNLQNRALFREREALWRAL